MDNVSLKDFETAGRAVLTFLHKRYGFGLWMVTRTEGDDWIVLQAEDDTYDVGPGTVFRWADTLCSEMVKGDTPNIAPDTNLVPAYADAPITQQVKIGAYVGMPLVKTDGSVFGTLCAIDPVRQPDVIVNDEDLIALLAALLSKVLQSDLKAAEETRRSERLEVEAQTDALTGLYNRRAWDDLVAKEDKRCLRYGHPAAIVVIDLDALKEVNDTYGHAAGDELIARAALALRDAGRNADVVARLGGDEFALLAVECDQRGAEEIAQRVRNSLADAKIKASVGVALRGSGGLTRAHAIADTRMYEEKRAH
jgi:diguanylate cyclase